MSLYPYKPQRAGSKPVLSRVGCPSSSSPPTLLFDVSLTGFYRWCRKRLELLGFKVAITKYRYYDYQTAEEARRLGAIVVTTDKSFEYEPKIILPMQKPKYEVWLTLLFKGLRNKNIE